MKKLLLVISLISSASATLLVNANDDQMPTPDWQGNYPQDFMNNWNKTKDRINKRLRKEKETQELKAPKRTDYLSMEQLLNPED